ncbi:MAG: chromosome segregation protein SMC [Actinobacteria bacterium]|nr:MAG: chromosome segregation protein SMC [Actinomycetota bacterium]
MFLRRLVIRGFKSFADKTVFDFTPGVAVIVGPNGSGKSNLVDAIAWVLGEQGAKTLRGGKMEDVIFAGTPKRPALGRAEVELTIDNSSGVLPIDFTEVSVRRTLFRTGESEYAINDVPCRLLDVQELLSDSGIGRELHTIVGQGQLDEILAGRPEDRRAVIEEASGLLKHRKRKERAVRKLERVDADIERLGDVIAELRRQIRPLERQAEVAKRASEIEAELREVKLKLWVLEYSSVTGEEDAEAERRAVEYRLAASRDRLDALAGLASERATHLDDLAAREPRDEAPSIEEIARAEEALAEARAARERAEEEARHAEAERHTVQTAREEASRAREEVVHLHGERAALRAAVEAAEDERTRLLEHRGVAQNAADRSQGGLAEVRQELERLDADETMLGAKLDDAEARATAQRRAVEEIDARALAAERRIEALTARREMLIQEVSRAHDPAALLEGVHGIAGRVIDQVRAAEGYERALRAALGPLSDAVLATSRADAMAALERLKRDGGRASIAVPGASIYAPVPVGVRSLLHVVSSVGPHADLVRGLLSGIALADSLAEAAELSRAHPGIVVVTAEGDRLGANVVTGGAREEIRDPRDELRSRDDELATATDELGVIRREHEHARAELHVLETETEEISERLNALDAQVAGATERLAQLERESHATAREDSVITGRLSEVEERLREDTEKLRAVESRLGRAVASEPEVDLQTLVQIERLAAERALHLGESTERERAAVASLNALQAREQRVSEMRAQWETGRTAWTTGAARARAVAEAAGKLSARASRWVEDARAQRSETEERRRALEALLVNLRKERRDAEAALDEARTLAHQSDLRRAERSHRVASLVQRARDEYQMSPEEALEAVRPDPEEADELTRRAATLDRRLGLLGRVNPIAMEQYQGLVDRHTFLSDQVNDLKRSRRDLTSVVAEVDQKIVEIFGAAFQDVAREFNGVFARLFPGGEGRMVLTDPDDLLNSGVDVEARPAGKRVKRVSLLSGGERSLVAVALLFSVFRARPSPFYLLDEVEPALDDVNLHRFLEIAAEFRDRSQLLIVTHQKRTMEIADVLYGISMAGEGVSKVICERLETPDGAQSEQPAGADA